MTFAIFIGNSPELGADGIGGITVAFPVMIILMAIGMLFGIGGTTLFSIRLGQKKTEDAEKALGNALMLLVLTGVIATIAGQIFLRPILSLLGASDAILPYALEYLRTILFGSVFFLVSMGMNNFIRADGSPKTAMITMFFAAGLNIILDPILIFGLNMGMTGAALATILSQAVAMVWVLSYFLGPKSRVKLKRKNLRLELAVVSRIASLGLPGALMQLANSILHVILNRTLLYHGGDIAISAMGIINSLQLLLIMPIIGINQGAQPIISFNYGARHYGRVKDTAKWAIIAGTVIVLLGYAVIRLFPVEIVSLFNRDPELLEFSTYALRRWMLLLPVVGFQVVASNFFQAIGRYKVATFLTLSRQVVLLIPAILIFSAFRGLDGLLYAAPFSDFFSTLLTGIWFISGMKRLGREKSSV